MSTHWQTLRLRVTDAAHLCWAGAFPSDRPSGCYPVYTCLINGSLLVWTFAIILSSPCDVTAARWIYLGMLHCFINMSFSIAVMVFTRRQIAAGILSETSQWRVCFGSLMTDVYLGYCLWEVIWMIVAGQYSTRNPSARCASHLTVQRVFFVLYLLLGAALFYATFITERCRRPRWRRFAAMRYDYLHNEQSRRTVRWNDEQEEGRHEAVVDLDRFEARPRDDTERTTTLDYDSIMEDSTAGGDELLDESRLPRQAHREGGQ